MYKKEIEGYMEAHRQEMIDDICTLCRINSEKMPYSEGKALWRGALCCPADGALHGGKIWIFHYQL